jgi:hypothetical protein
MAPRKFNHEAIVEYLLSNPEFPYRPGMPCPFPIVPAATRAKHDAVGHLSNDGRVHVFNVGIIEKLVRPGLRMRR